MTKEEALRMALEALERSVATCFDQYSHDQVMSRPEHFINQTITAIKEALAQQITIDKLEAQRTWVGLTMEDKKGFWTADQMTQDEWDELFSAIEAKLKEKNAP